MTSIAQPLARPRAEEPEDPREHLMHDPRPRGEMNTMVMEAMHVTSWKFWVVAGALTVIVLIGLVYAWYDLTIEGLGVAGVNLPVFWGIFLSNVIYWIGISHTGTFISAILRVLKIETRRSFTRAAELMTVFGLVQVGFSVFMHMGRSWLAYWMLPIPSERAIWPDFHSPLMWDFIAITTYVLCSSMYLFLPLIPDLAMARDRTEGGWRKTFYRILSLGFRGTEGEWKNLTTAMNVFAFAIIPVMFSVSTIVSWDFAMATRPGWSSTVFGPYFVVGALHSGIAALAVVLFFLRSTMKNYKYFIRPEHFDTIGKLMLMISLGWAYFYFNDYLVPWYGGNRWDKLLQQFVERGPVASLWFIMLFCSAVVPWALLWKRSWRRTPWLLAVAGILINVGMWLERYIIVPVNLSINRMPFTWRLYIPNVEIPLSVGLFALFALLYMLASRFIPLVPVWEVQEGQESHIIRKIGKAEVSTFSDIG